MRRYMNEGTKTLKTGDHKVVIMNEGLVETNNLLRPRSHFGGGWIQTPGWNLSSRFGAMVNRISTGLPVGPMGPVNQRAVAAPTAHAVADIPPRLPRRLQETTGILRRNADAQSKTTTWPSGTDSRGLQNNDQPTKLHEKQEHLAGQTVRSNNFPSKNNNNSGHRVRKTPKRSGRPVQVKVPGAGPRLMHVRGPFRADGR